MVLGGRVVMGAISGNKDLKPYDPPLDFINCMVISGFALMIFRFCVVVFGSQTEVTYIYFTTQRVL